MMDEVLTWVFPDGMASECFCSHCRSPWLKRWVHCPHCSPEKYADFERRRSA